MDIVLLFLFVYFAEKDAVLRLHPFAVVSIIFTVSFFRVALFGMLSCQCNGCFFVIKQTVYRLSFGIQSKGEF